jgi:hypothetical protein
MPASSCVLFGVLKTLENRNFPIKAEGEPARVSVLKKESADEIE